MIRAAAPGPITVAFDTPAITARATVGAGSRTIAGVAVPWNVPGRVSSGELVVFHPGSLDATTRPVALRDHDPTRPIGVVVDAVDNTRELEATVRASATRDGDDALVLAGDGALPMFSVGATPTEYSYDGDGVLHVHAAEWNELSLLTFGAYTGARVSTVTATTTGGTMEPDVVTTPEPDVDPDVTPDPETEPNPDIEPDVPETPDAAAVPAVPVTAGRVTTHAVARPARHPYAGVGIRELSRMLQASAASADPQLVRRITQIMTSPGARAAGDIHAALADVGLATTTNVNPAYRPAYQAELIDIVSHGAPLVDILRQGDLERGDYPIKTFNQWVARPVVALQTAEKTEINSVPLEIEPTSVDVETWATGNDLSQQLLDFGSPSFVEDYIRAAGVSYSEVIQTYAATAMLAVATNVPTLATDTYVQIIGKLVSALNPANVPPGGLFAALSWDMWAGLIGVPRDEGPAFWSGNVSFGSMLPSADLGGLSNFYAPGLPARTVLLGLRNAATWYDLPGTPFSLRAVNVGQLGLDVAVYGYGALGVQYPLALVKTTQPAA